MIQRGAEDTLAIIQWVAWGILVLVGVLIITGQGPAALRLLGDLAAKAGAAATPGTGGIIKNVIIPGA